MNDMNSESKIKKRKKGLNKKTTREIKKKFQNGLHCHTFNSSKRFSKLSCKKKKEKKKEKGHGVGGGGERSKRDR